MGGVKFGAMRALVVGADWINQLLSELKARGFDQVDHWSGRSLSTRGKAAKNTTVVIILIDYCGHKIMERGKAEAQRLGIPVVYCKRAVHELKKEMDRAGFFACAENSHAAG